MVMATFCPDYVFIKNHMGEKAHFKDIWYITFQWLLCDRTDSLSYCLKVYRFVAICLKMHVCNSTELNSYIIYVINKSKSSWHMALELLQSCKHNFSLSNINRFINMLTALSSFMRALWFRLRYGPRLVLEGTIRVNVI